MNIEDRYELVALHRCLSEAKINANPDDYDIAGSPIVAKLANEVLASLREIEGEKWDEWRNAENHQERIDNLIKALKKQNLNHISSEQQRLAFIKNALAPLIASENIMIQVMSEVFSEQNI